MTRSSIPTPSPISPRSTSPSSLTLSEAAARQALLDRFRVHRLEEDVADLRGIIVLKDSIIQRQKLSLRELGKPLSPADPVARSNLPKPPQPSPVSDHRLLKASAENWAWRSLAAYLIYEALKASLTR